MGFMSCFRKLLPCRSRQNDDPPIIKAKKEVLGDKVLTPEMSESHLDPFEELDWDTLYSEYKQKYKEFFIYYVWPGHRYLSVIVVSHGPQNGKQHHHVGILNPDFVNCKQMVEYAKSREPYFTLNVKRGFVTLSELPPWVVLTQNVLIIWVPIKMNPVLPPQFDM